MDQKQELYEKLHEWIEITGICPRHCSYEGELESFIDEAFDAAAAAHLSTIEAQAKTIEAMRAALEAAEALIAERPRSGGKTWTLKVIRSALALAQTGDAEDPQRNPNGQWLSP